jgi:hypothetical protein
MHKLLFSLTVFFLAGSLFAAESSFPFAGTWTLNLAESKFEGPMKPPREFIIILQEQGDQVLETDKGVAADGSLSRSKILSPLQEASSNSWKADRRREPPW